MTTYDVWYRDGAGRIQHGWTENASIVMAALTVEQVYGTGNVVAIRESNGALDRWEDEGGR